MSDRPSFDLTRLSRPDKVLMGASILLFLDSFLHWQRRCADLRLFSLCESRTAWGGNGAFPGAMMALLAMLLFLGEGFALAGVAMPEGVAAYRVMATLTAGTVVFGVVKVLLVVGNHGALGAWIGLVLIAAIAYGGFAKMRELNLPPSSSGSGFPG